jgi:hypothetical protein
MAILTEADTCRKYVLPKFYDGGWNDDQISEQKSFTDGRIVVAGNKATRRPQKRADYLLKWPLSIPAYCLEPAAFWSAARQDAPLGVELSWREESRQLKAALCRSTPKSRDTERHEKRIKNKEI